MPRVTISVTGLTRLITDTEKAISGLEKNAGYSRELIREIFKVIERNFESGGPRGAKWKRNSKLTQLMKGLGIGYYSRGGKGTKPLNYTGRLKKAVTTQGKGVRITANDNVTNIDFSPHPWASVHHFGRSIRRPSLRRPPGSPLAFPNNKGAIIFSQRSRVARVKIPKRPFYTDVQLIQVATQIYKEHVKKAGKSKYGWLSAIFSKINVIVRYSRRG